MSTTTRTLLIATVLAALAAAVSCGGSDSEEPDPFASTFREGIYTRTDDGKTYEIRFGVSIGRFVILVDGAEQRRGTHTTVSTREGNKPALAIIDEGEFSAKCAEDQLLGVYLWTFKDNKLKLDPVEEKCDQRKKELASNDWLYQGPAPTETPAPVPTASP